MASNEFIAAIELSSSHIAGIVGRRNADNSLHVLAYAAEPSTAYIHKGVVLNIDETANTLTTLINRLEAQLGGAAIARVYVGIGGLSMRTVLNSVSREVGGDGIISAALVDNLCDENLASTMDDMDILDVAPQEYQIDNTPQVRAVGVAGSHITATFLNIVARTPLKKNLELSFERAKLEIADLVIAPTALAGVVLTDTEMRSGCALIDFGAGTTTVSVYKNNILRYLCVIPLGGSSITHDLSTLQMEEQEAESLKQHYGDLCYEEENSDVPATARTEDGRAILLTTLNEIVTARAEEILANAWNQIQLSGYADRLLSGVVLTGGGVNLKHIEEALRKLSKLSKIRTARFVQPTVNGMDNDIKRDGTFGTLIGLLVAGRENCRQDEQVRAANEKDNEAELLNPVEAIEAEATTPQKDLFEDDKELKKRAAQIQEEKKEAQKEKKPKAEKGMRWFDKLKDKAEKLTNDLFSDEDYRSDEDRTKP
ncbi:MAG: cell division protein FtsA [Prevotellaceae bacterium]|jgi:cell division protein FtsA|nr:cell division protein FtsA [Prevotellaceae bacterium]